MIKIIISLKRSKIILLSLITNKKYQKLIDKSVNLFDKSVFIHTQNLSNIKRHSKIIDISDLNNL